MTLSLQVKGVRERRIDSMVGVIGKGQDLRHVEQVPAIHILECFIDVGDRLSDK